MTREPTSPGANTDRAPLIEVGWLVLGTLPEAQREAVERAREDLRKTLEAWFPGFTWRMPRVDRPGEPLGPLEEPAVRLMQGAGERDARAWDFALVIVPGELHTYYKSYAMAVPSRALATAVLSTSRLASADAPPEQLAGRIAALALHLFGDLNGLWHREDEGAVMHPPSAVADLDGERVLSGSERDELERALREVADLRLEEASPPGGRARFYLRAARERFAEIASAVLQARPWELPLRLSRLTTTALSAVVILMLTAEVWDLGARQPPLRMVGLSAIAVATTTLFILVRQKLLIRTERGRPTEQVVVTNVSAVLVVLLGMLTTYALLYGVAVGAAEGLFRSELVARWAPGGGSAPRIPVLAAFVASVGLWIGSLGASFEGDHTVQHVIFADEET